VYAPPGWLQALASPHRQAGTASSCLAGVPQYDAFYEWYPGIYATDFPIVVRPGDSLTIRIEEAQPDYWLLSGLDSATGQRSTTATFYHTDTGSADWSDFDTYSGPFFDGTAKTRLVGARLTAVSDDNWPGPVAAGWASHFKQTNWTTTVFDYVCDEPPAT